MSTPVATPAAPTIQTADSLDRMSDEAFMVDLGIQPSAVESEAPEGQERGADGKFVAASKAVEAKPGSPVEGEEVEGEGEGTPAVDDDAGTVVAPTHGLKFFDKDGELSVGDDIEVEITADGKTEKVPLEKLKRWAQNGKFAERAGLDRKTALDELETVRSTSQAEVTRLKSGLDAQMALARKLFEDEEFFLEKREEYARLNTPEERLNRDRRAFNEERTRVQQETQTRQMNDYISTTMEPTLARLLEDNPLVTFEEAFGRFSLLSGKLLVNGVIPLDRLPEAQRLLEQDVAEFVKERHTARSEKERTVAAASESAIKKQQEATAAAKRGVARTLAPKGRVAADTPTRKAPVTSDDAVKDILAEIAAG